MHASASKTAILNRIMMGRASTPFAMLVLAAAVLTAVFVATAVPATTAAAAAILLEEAARQGRAEADAGQDDKERHFQFAHVGLRKTFILSRSTSQTAKKSQIYADDGRGAGIAPRGFRKRATSIPLRPAPMV